MPLFGKHKSAAEVVRSLKEAITALDRGDKKSEKAYEDITKYLHVMKTILLGTVDAKAQNDISVVQLSQEIYNSNILLPLIKNLHRLEFENRKDVANIFNNTLRRQVGNRFPGREYVYAHQEIPFLLLKGYEQPDIALNCGSMLRECFRHEPLAKLILYSDEFYKFFDYVEQSTFDAASDAFSTFKELLTRNKMMAAEFLETNYDNVFQNFKKLMLSSSYVTRIQSLKLLGELLLDRHNYTVMTKYISSSENLKSTMKMLRDEFPNIQFEAYHVFKIFVANPNKPKPILDILLRNQEKLVDYLTKFRADRSDSEQFNDEKAYLIKQIKELKPAAEETEPEKE